MDLKEEHILGESVDTHWYYASKARAMKAYLSGTSYGPVLDVGAGSGFFSKFLLKNGIARRATCVDPGYPREWAEMVASRHLEYVRCYQGDRTDLILFMDVLEHVEDDVGLLKKYVDAVRPGGEVFISVPAFQSLWSSHDEYLGHHRRYTVPHLSAIVEQAGLSVTRCTYCFGLVFPLAVARRLAMRYSRRSSGKLRSDLKLHSAPVNAGLKLLCAVERPFTRLNKLAGLSVFCMAKKRSAHGANSG